jgi:hypothetical protein
VDEVDLDPVDLGCELGERVQSLLALAPVIVGRPVAGERLQRRQLHALGAVGNELCRRPPRRGYPAAEVVQVLLRNIYVIGADCAVFGLRLIGGGRWGRA